MPKGGASQSMVFISKKRGESKDILFRKFTRSFIDEDVIDDVRKKLFYKKPSLVKKEKEKERRVMRSRSNRIRNPRRVRRSY